MSDALAIWLYGQRIALVEQVNRRLRLSYTEEALETHELGTPLLSWLFPLTSERYTHGKVKPFLDGLLPEGDARRTIAADLELLASDTYALTRALGRESAGALVIVPVDEPPDIQATTTTASPLDDAELGRLVANLRSSPLGIDARVRLSLAGVQEKLLLTRMPDGAWGRPVDGTPSTHILKPEIARYANTVENEAFCMRVAGHLGLFVADVETTIVGNRKLIVVERFDRIVRSNGAVERVHQEDLCQALGIRPEDKYQENRGPSLRQVAQILEASAGPTALQNLLRAVTLNVLLGNGDAHGKNFSLLHEREGTLRLAPLYDLMSTLFYGDERLAMYVDDVRRTTRVTADRIVNEAARWGVPRRQAADIVAGVVLAAPAAAEAADRQTDGVPTELRTLFDGNVTAMRISLATAAAGR